MDRAPLRVAAFAVGSLLGGVSTWSSAATVWPDVDGRGVLVRSNVTGTVSVGGPFSVWPAANDGAGGAVLKGQQVLKLPKAQATVALSRAITVGNLARVARVAAGFAGPLALVGLAYEGIQYANGAWTKDDPSAPLVLTTGTTVYQACVAIGSVGGWAPAADMGGWYRIVAFADGAPSGWTHQLNCTNLPPDGGQYPRLFWKVSATPPVVGQVPASDADVEHALQSALQADPSKAAALAQKATEFVPVSEWVTGPTQATGPATVNAPGSMTTTSSDAGIETRQQSTTYNITYAGDVVNVTETTTTTITAPDNSVTTTTTTTEAPSSGGEGPPPEDKLDVCVEHPDASGCEPLGENEDDTELGEEQRDVDFDQELSDAGSCPTGKSVSVLGKSYTLEWTPLCDLASGVRPVVIALSWLSATVFVFMIGRGTTA